jgi:error-prone DNA polymerase
MMVMAVANFSAADADQLRRSVGMRRSWQRMKDLEGKLRTGMTANGIAAETQELIIDQVSSFALYGFPESHAASFAMIAYQSAYIKEHYLAAFTAALLNNQPMGFYSAAVIVEDARRHGLRVKAIDVQVSDWLCSIEHEADFNRSLRLGLGYAKGLRRHVAEALVKARTEDGLFLSIEDLTLRVPSLTRGDLALLARIGALNQLEGIAHRRDALWQVERAGKLEGPLLRQQSDWLNEDDASLPLQLMNDEERLVADYAGMGLTVGHHPMHYRRKELRCRGFLTACDLQRKKTGEYVRTAGLVIVKQRPGTAKGLVFLSVADETGIFNVMVTKEFFERNRQTVTQCKFISVEGPLQNDGGVIHVRSTRMSPLPQRGLKVESHDFH